MPIIYQINLMLYIFHICYFHFSTYFMIKKIFHKNIFSTDIKNISTFTLQTSTLQSIYSPPIQRNQQFSEPRVVVRQIASSVGLLNTCTSSVEHAALCLGQDFYTIVLMYSQYICSEMTTLQADILQTIQQKDSSISSYFSFIDFPLNIST